MSLDGELSLREAQPRSYQETSIPTPNWPGQDLKHLSCGDSPSRSLRYTFDGMDETGIYSAALASVWLLRRDRLSSADLMCSKCSLYSRL